MAYFVLAYVVKMIVLAIVILILLGLYVILHIIRHRNAPNIKVVLIIGAIAVGLIVINNTLNKDDATGRASIPYYQEIAPSVQDAPSVLPTPGRAYYIATFKENAEYITLTNYYYFNDQEWEFSSIPLPFDKSLPEFNKLQVYKRNIRG